MHSPPVGHYRSKEGVRGSGSHQYPLSDTYLRKSCAKFLANLGTPCSLTGHTGPGNARLLDVSVSVIGGGYIVELPYRESVMSFLGALGLCAICAFVSNSALAQQKYKFEEKPEWSTSRYV